jgi:predicted kinase
MNDEMIDGVHRALHPRLIIVSGQGGSGKTTLAHDLALVVGCPAICRDEIKEGMVHAYGPGFEAAPGDPLTQRTYPLFFNVIRLLLDGGVTVVAEAAFQHSVWERGLIPLLALADLRVLRCSTSNEEMLRRRRHRLAEVATRAAHADKSLLFNDVPQPWDAIHIDAPTLDVNTTHGYAPALHEIAAFVNARDEKEKA